MFSISPIAFGEFLNMEHVQAHDLGDILPVDHRGAGRIRPLTALIATGSFGTARQGDGLGSLRCGGLFLAARSGGLRRSARAIHFLSRSSRGLAVSCSRTEFLFPSAAR